MLLPPSSRLRRSIDPFASNLSSLTFLFRFRLYYSVVLKTSKWQAPPSLLASARKDASPASKSLIYSTNLWSSWRSCRYWSVEPQEPLPPVFFSNGCMCLQRKMWRLFFYGRQWRVSVITFLCVRWSPKPVSRNEGSNWNICDRKIGGISHFTIVVLIPMLVQNHASNIQ